MDRRTFTQTSTLTAAAMVTTSVDLKSVATFISGDLLRRQFSRQYCASKSTTPIIE